MKQKHTLLILILVFVLVIGGAYVLYDQLGDKVTQDILMTEGAVESPTQETKRPHISEFDFVIVICLLVHISCKFWLKADNI